MSKLLKIVLLLGAAMMGLLVVVGIAAYFLFKSKKDELARVAETTKVEAKHFARGRQPSACVEEGLKRLKACSGLQCELEARLFLRACLGEMPSAPSEFCSGVPAKSEILASVGWRVDRCEEYGLGSDHGCPRVLDEWQNYCVVEP